MERRRFDDVKNVVQHLEMSNGKRKLGKVYFEAKLL